MRYIWSRGLRPLGDFLVDWTQQRTQIQMRLLDSPESCIAVMPDDMLAMKELYLARQGKANASQCQSCKCDGVVPIVSSDRSNDWDVRGAQ